MSFTEFINNCEQSEDVEITHAILCSQDRVLAKYVKYPYKMDSLKLFFSMTKSFASFAIGIASDLGLLNIDDYIVKYFEDELPQIPDQNLDKVTIRNLLTMSSGIHDNTYGELVGQNNWIKAFLRQAFPHEPGTYYRYSTHGSHMLSAIITKVSGVSLADFLNQYMFHPMEIYEAQWEYAPEGLIAGGMGLSLYPMSMVKVAQMLLNKGAYQGKRIISEEYLSIASNVQIIKQDEAGDSEKVYSGAGYGFQIHIGKDGYYRLDGAFGQVCLICPEKERAVIIFSQKSKTETVLKLIYEDLLGDTGNEKIFGNDIWNLKMKSPEAPFQKCIAEYAKIPLAKYCIDDNPLGIESLKFARNAQDMELKLYRRDRVDTIWFAFEKHAEGSMYFVKDLQEHLQEYVCTAKYENSLKLQVYLIETPYVATYQFGFDGNEVEFNFSINVSFTLKNFVVKGHLEK